MGGASSQEQNNRFDVGLLAEKEPLVPDDVDISPSHRQVSGLFNERSFRTIRQQEGIPNNFLNDGWSFNDFRPGGGKGGTLMAFIEGRYIVKELSKADHEALLKVTPSYLDHVSSGDSCLAKILLHFQDQETKKFYYVMRNEIGDETSMDFIYDLKGCADDKTIQRNKKKVKVVHKRIWNIAMWGGQCCWSPERVIYFDGKTSARKLKIPIPVASRDKVLKALRRDTEWLATNNLMDYSLLVAVRSGPIDSEADAAIGRKPIIYTEPNGTEKAMYLSVIDFLQEWNTSKQIAYYIKAFEKNKATIKPELYAERFYGHFDNAISAAPR